MLHKVFVVINRNATKATIWGTNSAARKRIHIFPNMQLCLEFDVLGVKIYTSDRALDARNIAALPVPVSARFIWLQKLFHSVPTVWHFQNARTRRPKNPVGSRAI